MEVNGSCLCGACAWSAEVDPKRIFVCHCDDCQIQSGSAFRTTASIDPASFTLTRGELRTFTKTAESGAGRALAFCATCGTHAYGGPGDGGAGMMSLRLGPLDRRDELKPVLQVWCRSKQTWVDELADLPALATQPGVDG